MPNRKFFWSFLGLMVISLTSIGLLVTIHIHQQTILSFIQSYLPFRNLGRGNEFSGEVAAWLFGALSFPVIVDLISRTIIRYIPLGETGKYLIRRMNNMQRKYLMPFHTYLSIPALAFGILHLILSSCAANPLPELGLGLLGILVVTGLIFKGNILPKTFRKTIYQFHSNLIVSGVILLILFIGHAIMEFD